MSTPSTPKRSIPSLQNLYGMVKARDQQFYRRETAGFTLGMLASLFGGLILGKILNLSLFIGAGEPVVTGLTSTAAVTAVSLIALSLASFITSCYLLAKSALLETNAELEMLNSQEETIRLSIISSPINELLKGNAPDDNNKNNQNTYTCTNSFPETPSNHTNSNNTALFFAKSESNTDESRGCLIDQDPTTLKP